MDKPLTIMERTTGNGRRTRGSPVRGCCRKQTVIALEPRE